MSRECGLEAKLRSPRESSSLREKTNEKCDAKEARGTAKHREGFIANRPLVSDQVELLQICRSMNVGYIYMAPTKVRCYEFVWNMAQPRTVAARSGKNGLRSRQDMTSSWKAMIEIRFTNFTWGHMHP